MALSGRARSTRGLVILLVTVSLVTITLDYKEGTNGPLARIGQAALSIITPLQNAVTTITHPIGSFFGALVHLPSLQDENNRLRTRIQQLQTQAIQYQSLRHQLIEAEKLLELTTGLDLRTTGARVIGSGVSNFEWSIDIDKGSSNGIKVGMAVMTAAGLVGHVSEVSPFGSKVQLLVDPDSQVAARLVQSQETGLLRGQGDQDLAMSLVSSLATVTPGEPVETAGYDVGSQYPAGIPIGLVSRVRDDPSTGQKIISIRPGVDFSTLDVVLVVVSGKSG
ncbi:MAG: rod shape-determining protein MreC [Actinomycetota bacterium]|nr:rod shape-determining protein MreC [Actinomycetota bacterium]